MHERADDCFELHGTDGIACCVCELMIALLLMEVGV